MNNKAQSWFAQAIASGIQRLMVLSLEGTPSSRTVELTTVTWIDALWPGRAWDARLDETRIAEAFRLLTIQSERWPTPAQFLRVLPARHVPLKLTAPKPTEAERKKAHAVLERIKKELNR
ncbi:MAG TPA: hypothetical protein PKD44_08645 [Nitrosomonas sp.]|nr:hypothetical protein [Nitrosomonas sp.]HNJ38232.1 hypothetical protein [Nitrosomonas sp.]